MSFNPFKPVKKVFDSAKDVVGDITGHNARKEQKKAQKEQERIIAQEKKKALEKRKHQIDQMREQRSGGKYKTRATSTTGVRGRIKDEEELG